MERVLAAALGASDDKVEIACLDSEYELLGSLKRSLPDVVVIDDEKTLGRTEDVVETLREVAYPSPLEVIVLVRNDEPTSPRLTQLDVVSVPKPVNMHVLRSVTARLARRIAERRSSAQRRFLFDELGAFGTEPMAIIPTSY